MSALAPITPAIANGDEATDEAFAASLLDGLRRSPKRIESKWLYDAEGSRLFDAITALPEYYPTRIETAILGARAPGLRRFAPPGAALVELGSGSSVKTRLLLEALPSLGSYVPIDISGDHLLTAAGRLGAIHPEIDVHPLIADFTGDIALPAFLRAAPKILFFPGSTIGNFETGEAEAFLARLARWPAVTALVIGVDLIKDQRILERAYDDSQGVTAAFNLNLLARANRELEADFAIDQFRHSAPWNPDQSRIEMHLVSTTDQVVTIQGERFVFRSGETIHTENSHKYNPVGFGAMAAAAGWWVAEVWLDQERLFSVQILVPRAG